MLHLRPHFVPLSDPDIDKDASGTSLFSLCTQSISKTCLLIRSPCFSCADASKPRKRGRPPKTARTSGDFSSSLTQSHQPSRANHESPGQIQDPQSNLELASRLPITPTQASPTKQTPTKAAVKALPTVRDHTSDQLGEEGDEYIPREFDDAGEKKVDTYGYAQGGREFKCRTFTVPERGLKLFMLATECARVLNYRDSYLLFNKNRSLYKIIASQPEKDHLISREILPYSYRSRQIAIVTAKSMFRQFGSRVILNGRRVRDDYWESKARKQGFTEEDPAGEKRPGGAKAREAAAQENAMHALPAYVHGDIVYSNGPLFDGIHPQQLPPGLAASLGPSMMGISASKDYSNISRPLQENPGAPYQDRSQPTSATEIMTQAAQSAEFNKSLSQSRSFRGKGLEDMWHKNREPAVSTPQAQTVDPIGATTSSKPLSSPHYAGEAPSSVMLPNQQSHSPYGLSQNPNHSPIHRQNSLQTSLRDSSQYPAPPNLQRASPGLSVSHGQPSPGHQSNPYNYSSSLNQQQVWGGPPPQPHVSPALSRMSAQQFSPSLQNPSGQQIPSPVQSHHPSQSPHPPQQIHPSQMHHQPPASGQVFPSGVPGIQGGLPSYQGMGGSRPMYPASQSQQQYMQQVTQAGGIQGWPASQPQSTQGAWSTY